MPESARVTLSVGLSTYNGGEYVVEQLNSILGQTVLPDQIVVGDDGSVDGTLSYIEEVSRRSLAAGHPIEWLILPSEHLGLTGNKERILANCTQDVIVWCDHDDICLADRFERVQTLFTSTPGLLYLHGDAELIDSTGKPMGMRLMSTQGVSDWERQCYLAGEAFRVLVRRNIATGATIAFRTELLGLAGRIPDTWVYDEWLAIIAAAVGGTQIIGDPVLLYRQHAGNKQGVRRRTPLERLHLLIGHGRARNDRQLARAEVLAARVHRLGLDVPQWVQDLTAENLRHERVRSGFPTNRFLRPLPVLREVRSGAYNAVARGKKDILLDLVQPTS